MSGPQYQSWPARGETAKALLLLALFALAVRGWTFGNPLVHVDDQFYLFVGERMLHGAMPYTDLWDRKPVGLFLIYELASAAFGDGVIGYQLLAWLSVSFTALMLFVMARRLVRFWPALAGAAAYVAWLPLFGGIGGQAPVFYNLPVAGAAMLTLAQVSRGGAGSLTLAGCLAMLLMGIALQIKYSAVFEGIYFGLCLLWAGWKAGRRPARLAGDAMVWIGCALAPTLAAFIVYWRLGEAWLFVHANFVSVLADEVPLAPGLVRLFWQVLGLTPFWLCGWLAFRHWRAAAEHGRREALWLLGWAAAAFGGYLAFGNWFDHYVLPLLAPFSLVAALAFAIVARMRLAAGLVVGLGLAASLSRAAVDMADRGQAADLARVAALAERHRGSGCIYVTEDLPALYRVTRSCLTTRYIFPEHLALRRFTRSLGVDQAGELRRVMARRPSVVVRLDDPGSDYAPAARAVLDAELRRHYRLVGTARTGAIQFFVHARTGD